MAGLLPVGNVLGRLMMVFSLAYVVPIAGSFLFHDGKAAEFAWAMLVTMGAGGLLFFATRRHYRELKVRDGFLLVTLSWLLMGAIAALPLNLIYSHLSFTDAFFETISAMTTTGASVLSGLDHAPQSVNLWRHLLQWLGGLGIIVLAVAILPLLGVGGMQLYRAEMPGPMKEAKLTARIADTAKALYLVYAGATLLCMVSLRVAGMSWFDAVCHAFSAVSLGGFSTRDANVAAFDSPAIETVLVVFMFFGAINFGTHYLAWRGRSIRTYLLDSEVRAILVVLVAGCLAMAAFLHSSGSYRDLSTSLRHGIFNTASVALGGGFASVDYTLWPVLAPLLLLFLSSFTASSGSTGSGIKMVRALILLKQGFRELHKLLHPQAAHQVKLGHAPVPNKVVLSVLAFLFLYLASVVGTAFILVATGMDLTHALGAALACINNLGPGLGTLGPAGNYGTLTDLQKWTCMFAMLLGRLEIMSVLVLFTRSFWRK
ncbi:MAG TPA: potassium transporter TrkG [Usitatibacter sp.]|nr:potassium transporter TrkG [Usitatibacter sp.]